MKVKGGVRRKCSKLCRGWLESVKCTHELPIYIYIYIFTGWELLAEAEQTGEREQHA